MAPSSPADVRRLVALFTSLATVVGVTIAAPAAAAAAPTPTAPPGLAAPAPPVGPPPEPAPAGQPALGTGWQPTDAKPPGRNGVVPGQVLVMLASGTTITGAPQAAGRSLAARTPTTSNTATNTALAKVGARSIHPLLPHLSAADAGALAGAARSQLGTNAVDLANLDVVDVAGTDPVAAAATLRTAPGVAYAEPNRYVSAMSTTPTPVPAWAGGAAPALTRTAPGSASGTAPGTATGTAPLPTNYGLTSSLQSYLNANGVNALGAYDLLGQRYGQLPGTGEIITNVSIGDLTDQSMADAGNTYVQHYGPTTVVQNGQRYLDLPSMPLIPTYTASPTGQLNPTGSTTQQDPTLGEVLLDFGVMAPLPHDRQRAGRVGAGTTDLLGIAPGAQYRLVVPEQPTIAQIATALVAAAHQTPRPSVITASLGFGTDVAGFPGRYLEDDPVLQSVIAGIVHRDGIVVSISSNDGTRLYTPTAVGPDGGSTPTDLARNAADRTTINDVASSTTPSRVADSGAIAAGGTTLDDTLATPAAATSGTVAETRISGGGSFSSGFGTRVNLSAPSDGIVVFQHTAGGAASAVSPVLNGGTSASAPEIAAAAAVVRQTARLTGRQLSPIDVRTLLERTGRAVPTPAQIDRTLQVGPQVDVTAAVNSLLPRQAQPSLVRVSLAHRVTIGRLGGTFLESTDPTTLDLAGPNGTGQGLVGPVTFGLDLVNLPAGPLDYVLRVGSKEFHSKQPSIRALPADLLAAAGQPVIATANRTLAYTLEVRRGDRVLVQTARTLTVGPSDGTYTEAAAPVAPPVVTAGKPVTVQYDLTGVRGLNKPQLVVSEVGHWNPVLAPLFTAGYTVDLTATSGTVSVPASAFTGGGGLYGIGIATISGAVPIWGEFTPVRVAGGTAADRPEAPTLSTGGAFGHQASASRAAPTFSLRYDTRGVRGAKGTTLEISAPGPTLWGAENTFTNANGTQRDADGVTTGSVLYRQLPGAAGTVKLDALQLGLGTSTAYNVRVLGTDRHGTVVGQASASSQLRLDDGLVPNGGTVDSFGIAGPDSVAAVHDAGGASVLRYAPKTGGYGAALAHDSAPDSRYQVLGVDATAHRALLLHWSSTSTDRQVQTYDTGSGRLVGQFTLAGSAYQVLGGRVDAVRHRAALLAWRQPDRADIVLPVNLVDGALGAPIPADAPGIAPGKYGAIDLDQATGRVYLAHFNRSQICFFAAAGNVAAVNLDTGSVTPSGNVSNCAYEFASDGQGKQEYQLTYNSFTVNAPGTTSLVPLAADTLAQANGFAVRRQGGQGLAVDGTNNVGLVAFGSPLPKVVWGKPGGVLSDSNSTSEIQVVDLSSGAGTKVVSGLNFTAGLGNSYNADTERAIQLDPATRTGWTFGPGNAQIRQFSY